MTQQITLEHTFDAGHRIVGHEGKCARLHGHTYRVKLSVAGTIQGPGFVVDFGDLKDSINRWDHRLLLWDQDPLVQEHTDVLADYGLYVVAFNPTAENMAKHLAENLRREFDLSLCYIELWETPKSSARYMAS